MSFFETPLGERLQTALDEGKDNAVAKAVDELLEAMWRKQLDPELIQEAISDLQRHAQFRHAISAGDVALATGRATFETRRRYCQALIEIGALHAAELELTRLSSDDDVPDRERGEALGLLGRLQKQRYVFGDRGTDLRQAIETYFDAYTAKTDPAWHGVNLLALMHRAAEDKEPVPSGLPDVSELAGDILAVVRQKPANQRTIWDRATEVETLVGMGKTDEAKDVAEELAQSKNVNSFEMGSLRRQLTEVWRLEETDPVVLAVSDRLLQLGHQAAFDLPESPMQFEKIFGAALPIGYNTLLRGLRCAESVCKITDANGEGWGTGFLINGGLIHDSLGDETILATNAHVVSSTHGISQLRPVEVKARFDVLKGDGDNPLILSGMSEIWTSPPDRCDVTLLRFDGDEPALTQPIEAAPALPLANEGAFVYVVGHPAGAGLKFSIRGNDLLAYEKGGSKVHYTAPTEPGSSGSPVFTSQWQLMAVHHAGSNKMRRLDDPSKSYEANEGITLEAIRQEFALSLAG